MKGGYRYGQRTRRSLKSRRLTASGVKRSSRRRNSYRRKSRRHNRKSKRRQSGGGLEYSGFNDAYTSEIPGRMTAGAYPNTDMGYSMVLDKPPFEYYVATK